MVVSGCLWRIGLRSRQDFDSCSWAFANLRAGRADGSQENPVCVQDYLRVSEKGSL